MQIDWKDLLDTSNYHDSPAQCKKELDKNLELKDKALNGDYYALATLIQNIWDFNREQ